MIGERRAVRLERRIRARPETVFAFFTDPEKYRLWQGIAATLEPVPDGVLQVDFAPGVRMSGRYLVLDPPRRLVFTWGIEPACDLPPEMHGLPPGIGEVSPGSTTVEITLVAEGDETILRVEHTGLPTEDAERMHGTYWAIYLDRMAIAALGGDAGSDPVYAIVSAVQKP